MKTTTPQLVLQTTQVGKVRQALAEEGLSNSTIAAFLGANGMMRNSRGWSEGVAVRGIGRGAAHRSRTARSASTS